MCGITGFTGTANQDQLIAMTRALSHRGPDDEGIYLGTGINMGMRRLSIIDLERGHQPLANEDETLWVTCNGEIYNFQSLRPALQERGHRFRTHSDTEVLVHLYEEYGEDLFSHLNGMFAFAVWDSRNQRLMLARDRVGVKPLYYYWDGKNIYYASEIKSILKVAVFQKEISLEAFSHYLTFRNVPAPLTIYRNIYSLLPGEYLIWEKGNIRKQSYWELDFSKQTNDDEEEAEARILDILRDAVRLRLVSDVPVGAYLSGGVDSSLVVALMSELSDRQIKTFSLSYDDETLYKKDAYYARMISKQYGTEHHEYVMHAEELPQNLVEIIRYFDQPFGGVLSTFFLSKLVHQHVKVALTGDGADDQFGSYAHHRLCWPIENYVKAKRFNLPDTSVDFRPYVGQEEYVKSVAEEDLASWRIKFYALTDEEKEALLSPAAWAEMRSFKSLDLLRKNLAPTEPLDSLNRLLAVDFKTLLPDEILVFADRLSMAHSVELRSPYLDYRFAEYVAALPGTLKIREGIPKYLLKKIAARFLPQEVIDRPKEGFILPQDVWMRGKLKSYVYGLLAEDRLAAHGLLNPHSVRDLLEGYFEGRHRNSYKIWNLVMFQIWFENCYLAS